MYSGDIISPYIPPLAGDGDALGVDGSLVGVEVEHLILGPRPRSHVQQVAADLQGTKIKSETPSSVINFTKILK